MKIKSIILFIVLMAVIGCKKNATSTLNPATIDINILMKHTWYIDSVLIGPGRPDSTMACLLNCYLVFSNDSEGYFNDAGSSCAYAQQQVAYKYYIQDNATTLALDYNPTSYYYRNVSYQIYSLNDTLLKVWDGLAIYLYKAR